MKPEGQPYYRPARPRNPAESNRWRRSWFRWGKASQTVHLTTGLRHAWAEPSPQSNQPPGMCLFRKLVSTGVGLDARCTPYS